MIKSNEELYELVIEDENIDGIFAISLVQDPAIEADFVYFDKEKVQFSSVDNEQRLVMGAILIPNKKILRIDGEGKPYHVFFKPETIKRLSEMYLKNKYTDKATLEHNQKINGVTLVESWIKESATKDKSALYNLNAPVGSWLGTFKIDNDKIWNDYVKTGDVKGFSIEGLFGHSLVSANEMFNFQKDISLFSDVEAEILLEKIKAVFESYSDYGDGIRNNAKRGIELNEKVGNKCATQVGKVRAQQLANGEPISVETLKRMYSYLSRAEAYYDETDTEACGTISYLLWGGKAALSYSRNKLRELGLLEETSVDLKEGVPHYTADGKLYEGPTHKGPDGSLMTGETHTADSKPLYHKEELKLEAQPSVASSYPGEGPTSGSIIAPATFDEVPGNIQVYGIETEYFYMCPGAVGLFQHIQTMDLDEDTIGMVRSAALVADRVFDIEEDVIEDRKASPKDLGEAIVLVSDFKDIMKEIDDRVGMDHDVSFMDGHIQTIKKYL